MRAFAGRGVALEPGFSIWTRICACTCRRTRQKWNLLPRKQKKESIALTTQEIRGSFRLASQYVLLFGFMLAEVVPKLLGSAHFATGYSSGDFMSVDEPKGGASPEPATPSSSTGGGAPSDQERSKPLPGADKAIPIGTPLTPEQLRRLKEEAERPGRNPPATNKDSSQD